MKKRDCINPRSEAVIVRLTPDLKWSLRVASARNGMTVSEYIRYLIESNLLDSETKR